MAVYYKPQSPIQSGEDFIYPITTADQVKVDKDTRLNAVGVYLKNIDNSTDTTVYGNNATTLGGVAASDYALKTDTAPDSSKLGGKVPEYYLQPRNLLDNSDFTNPVNQRNAGTVVNDYVVDRWYGFKTTDGSVSITPDGITATGDGYLQHRLPSGTLKSGVVYTIAIYYSDGSIDVNTNGEYTILDQFDVVNSIKPNGKTIAHIALYEGTYTADTLPPYVPKGYAAELAECQRYLPFAINAGEGEYRSIGTGVALSESDIRINIPLPTSPRAVPNISFNDITALMLRGASYITPINISLDIYSMNSITITCTVSGAVAGGAYELIATPGLKLLMTSEL